MQYTNQKQEMILFLLERSTAQQDLGKKKIIITITAA